LSHLLGESLERRLALTPPKVRRTIALLVASDAPSRMAGLDSVLARLLPNGALADDAVEALPFLLALATAPSHPASSALLLRLTHLLSAIDDPPRSLAGARGSEASRRAYDAIEVERARLAGLAQRSKDPQAARLAACLLARFPRADVEAEPLLIALLSGTADPEQRAPLLYALTRVQASRGADFHGRIAAALQLDLGDPERLAVSLALAEHDPPQPLRARVVQALLAQRDSDAPPDPRTWNRRASRAVFDAALARLGAS
jgi:hypothetical protein